MRYGGGGGGSDVVKKKEIKEHKQPRAGIGLRERASHCCRGQRKEPKEGIRRGRKRERKRNNNEKRLNDGD